MTQSMSGAPAGPTVELEKLIALFTGPNSADLYDRHGAAIQRLCKNNASGFAIRDLPKVQQVLELSLALLKRGSAGFTEPLCELVGTFSKPFIRRTATDEFKMLNHITSLLTTVGDIFRSPGMPPPLVAVAAKTIATFANAYGNRPNALDLASQHVEAEGPQRQYLTNQSLLGKSGMVADVIAALARSALADRVPPTSPSARGGAPDPAEQARALAAPLLAALLSVSYNADSCVAMVEAGVLQCVAALLGRGSHADTSGAAVELLWNLLEQAPGLARAALSRALPSLEAVAAGAGLPKAPATPASGNGEAAEQQHWNGSQDGAAGPGAGASFSGGAGSRSAPMSSGVGGSRLANGSRLGSAGGGAGIGSIPASRGSVAASGLSAIAEGSTRGDGAGSCTGSEPASPSRAPGGVDDDWQQLPDGAAAGAGPGYEAAVSRRACSPGSASSALDEFADEPDIRPLRPGGLAVVAEESPGYSADGGAEPPPPPDAPVVQALADALGGLLRELLLSGFSKADKELRNDCMVVMGLLLEDGAFAAAASYSGVFEALIAAGTCPELGAAPALVANYALSTDVLDHELRLLVWAALVQGCLRPEVLEQAVASGLVRVLLLYVSPGEAHPAVRRWNPDQMATLRSGALSRLHTLSPLCPEEYERAGGPGTLLAFVGATNPGPIHLEAALRHLHRLFTMVPESRDALGGAGIIPVLLGVVADTVGSGAGGGTLGHLAGERGAGNGASALLPGSASLQPEPVRHFALLCLTALCSVHAENQRRLRKGGGVGVLLGALEKLRGLDALLPAPYAVAVLDCVWAAVVPDRKSAAKLLVDGGMAALLDHLEQGNKSHRPIVLRVLSDLLENPRSHPFFHDWQSDLNKQTAAHLLLSVWMEEDALRGITGPDGLLANTARPLAGLGKRAKWLPPENVAYGNMSPAKKETLSIMMDGLPSEIVLAKIYGIFKVLGFDACPYLDPADHAVLAAVEKYAKFRQGEVWRAIQEEFAEGGVKPTAPDRARLESGTEMSESLAAAVREAQARLLGRAQEGQRVAEARLFEGMRQQARLEAEYRTIALQEKTPLTLAEMRRAKEQKVTMLKNSLQSFQFQHGEHD
ncbi:hypothetical protein HYH02_009460 [Chlamydomonas schloesseri]|uniref:Cilia- and flagella-associated protein 69 ARM repeats domain-containing protein n=1 Tax=Chlamydomonas schloesseri TaxID=2026947 RepID=A0A835TRL2_9CHLO|nr:hypothetical protein HYH02_009460 [Chlamydomonas schloesseri]|eukprot:KAG2443045.1 hypothetical protein HYH02_009460 [Chlamydomonas schloesseri]